MDWAKERREWYEDDWGKVLWSDESTFELWRTKGRVWVGDSRVKDLQRSVLYPMAGSGVGSLTVVEGLLNSEAYIEVIRKCVKKDGKNLIGRRFIFQQDGTPCRTAKATTAAMQK